MLFKTTSSFSPTLHGLLVLFLAHPVLSATTPKSRVLGRHGRPYLLGLKKDDYVPKKMPLIIESGNTPTTTTNQTSQSGSYEKRGNTGRFTYYETGLGACGGYNNGNEYVVALNSPQWDGGSHCYKMIDIHYGDRSVQAQIVDECPSCPPGALDLSEGLFSHLADLDEGVIYGEWTYAGEAQEHTNNNSNNSSNNGKNDNNNHREDVAKPEPPKTKTKSEAEPKASGRSEDADSSVLANRVEVLTKVTQPTSTNQPSQRPSSLYETSTGLLICTGTLKNNAVVLQPTTTKASANNDSGGAGRLAVTPSGQSTTASVTNTDTLTTTPSSESESENTSTITGLAFAESLASVRGGDATVNNEASFTSHSFLVATPTSNNLDNNNNNQVTPGSNSNTNGLDASGQADDQDGVSNDGLGLQVANSKTGGARMRTPIPSGVAQAFVFVAVSLSLLLNINLGGVEVA